MQRGNEIEQVNSPKTQGNTSDHFCSETTHNVCRVVTATYSCCQPSYDLLSLVGENWTCFIASESSSGKVRPWKRPFLYMYVNLEVLAAKF